MSFTSIPPVTVFRVFSGTPRTFLFPGKLWWGLFGTGPVDSLDSSRRRTAPVKSYLLRNRIKTELRVGNRSVSLAITRWVDLRVQACLQVLELF